MHECISVHVGQAGLQVGSACWDLYCLEHGLLPNGHLGPPPTFYVDNDKLGNFFSQTSTGKNVPRCLMVDLEPTIIDKIATGPLRHLFLPEQFISGKDGGCDVFPRGFFTIGRRIVDSVVQRLRGMAENCECLQGFIITHSMGGGTGSGFTALLLGRLMEDYGKKCNLQFAVYPAPEVCYSPVEPYNALLGLNLTMENSDCVCMWDNAALMDICNRQLELENPAFPDLNSFTAHTISAITSSLRFETALNSNLTEFQTNLVPYPRVHFPLVSYAPILTKDQTPCQQLNVMDVTEACFQTNNQMVQCDTKDSVYMAACLLYAGDAVPKEINDAINALMAKRIVRFVDQDMAGFKVGVHTRQPLVAKTSPLTRAQRTACLLANTSAIAQAWTRLRDKFEKMFHKRAYVHWYCGEGMCESEFHTALDDVRALELDYKELTE